MTTQNPFAGFDVLEGFDPIDKAALVGAPFGITAVRFRTNERKVTFAELEILTLQGERKGFQDSSTGVRDQMIKYLDDKKIPNKGREDWVDIKLFVPNGLRVSEYDVEVAGHTTKAKTYYLTLQARERPAAA